MKNRIKSMFRLPRRGRSMITHKGYQRPYIRTVTGKLYLFFDGAYRSRKSAERISKSRFKDFIVVPMGVKYKNVHGFKKAKHFVSPKTYAVYVEADELVAYHKRRKK